MNRLNVRSHFVFLTVFLWVGFASSDALSQEAGFKNIEPNMVRVRARLLESMSAFEVERLLRDAFSELAESYVTRIRDATTEVLLIDISRSLAGSGLPVVARERVFEEIAAGLKTFGTKESLPLLRKLKVRDAEVLTEVQGCYAMIPVPVFDYQHAARRAEFHVLEREALREFRSLDAESQFEWFIATARVELRSPRLSAALGALAELGSDARDALREELLYADTITASAAELLVDIYRLDSVLPGAGEFRRLPIGAAQRFVLESVEGVSAQEREPILDRARSHPGVASLAAFLDVERGDLDPRRYLERDGASAAAVLSRDQSVQRTVELRAILTDGEASLELRRHAALGLIHQRTYTARGAIIQAISTNELPQSLGQKLERWLGR